MSVTISHLDLPRAPRWLDLPLGVRFRVRPLDSALFAAATRLAAERHAEGLPDWTEDRPLPQSVIDGLWTAALTTALAELAITEWEGVQAQDGSPAPCEPAEIRSVLEEEWIIAQDFHCRYVLAGEAMEQEGNGSPGSGSGGTAAAGSIAGDAIPDPAPAVPSGSTGR